MTGVNVLIDTVQDPTEELFRYDRKVEFLQEELLIRPKTIPKFRLALHLQFLLHHIPPLPLFILIIGSFV